VTNVRKEMIICNSGGAIFYISGFENVVRGPPGIREAWAGSPRHCLCLRIVS
jgi:hypothetical protein